MTSVDVPDPHGSPGEGEACFRCSAIARASFKSPRANARRNPRAFATASWRPFVLTGTAAAGIDEPLPTWPCGAGGFGVWAGPGTIGVGVGAGRLTVTVGCAPLNCVVASGDFGCSDSATTARCADKSTWAWPLVRTGSASGAVTLARSGVLVVEPAAVKGAVVVGDPKGFESVVAMDDGAAEGDPGGFESAVADDEDAPGGLESVREGEVDAAKGFTSVAVGDAGGARRGSTGFESVAAVDATRGAKATFAVS